MTKARRVDVKSVAYSGKNVRSALMAAELATGMISRSKDEDKIWIVVDLEMTDGSHGSMAFNNPSVPDVTLAERESSLSAAIPTLVQRNK